MVHLSLFFQFSSSYNSSMRGIIATDIDGTLTDKNHEIPKAVLEFLGKKHKEGFEIVFLTGRTHFFCKRVLAPCTFPFHLGVTNGTETLKMPQEKAFFKHFLTKEVAKKIASLNPFLDRGFIFYSGSEAGDFCYYIPHHFSSYGKEYIEKIVMSKGVNYKAIDSLDAVDVDAFSIIRAFGTLKQMEDLQKILAQEMGDKINSVVLRDVGQGESFLLFISEKNRTKGSCLQQLKADNQWTGSVIACGDDLNDLPLFEVADIKICMEDGHPNLLEKATLIAKPSYMMGIIEALDKAIGLIDD